jgi:hypothetical protein
MKCYDGSVAMQRTIDRLKAEFLEMPGLHLTAQQVQRLCGLEPAVCLTVLDALVESKFLQCVDGCYSLPTYARAQRPHPAKADLRSHSHKTRAS